MNESDFFNNTATDHHGEHHGNTVPNVHPNDGNVRHSESTDEDEEHSHHKEEKESREMKTTPNNRIARTFTGWAFAIAFAFSFGAFGEAKAFNTNFTDDAGFNARNVQFGSSSNARFSVSNAKTDDIKFGGFNFRSSNFASVVFANAKASNFGFGSFNDASVNITARTFDLNNFDVRTLNVTTFDNADLNA